jgi:hypothetical protein
MFFFAIFIQIQKMCYAIYIGTDKEQDVKPFVEGATYLYFEKVGLEDAGILSKFSKPHVYFAGSYQGCSCGFVYDTENWDDADTEEPEGDDHRRSAQELVDFLKVATRTEDVEYYCCWDGDFNMPAETSKEINMNTIEVDNYFEITEREFILFTS